MVVVVVGVMVVVLVVSDYILCLYHLLINFFQSTAHILSIPHHIVDKHGFASIAYTPPPILQLPQGKNMKIPTGLFQMMMSPPPFTELTIDTLRDYVFVTGADYKYIPNVLKAISSVQHAFPKKKILFYDLGIRRMQLQQVRYCTLIHFF